MMIGGEEGLVCQVIVDEVQLELKYLGFVQSQVGKSMD